MKHLRKFNESENQNDLEFKLVGAIDKEEVGNITIQDKYFNLEDGREVRGGYDEDNEFVLIVNDGKIEVAIYEYEISNPGVFGNIIIVPGNDSITLYDFLTDKHKVMYIR